MAILGKRMRPSVTIPERSAVIPRPLYRSPSPELPKVHSWVILGKSTIETARGRKSTTLPRMEAAVYSPASWGSKKWRTMTTSAAVGKLMARVPIRVGSSTVAKVLTGMPLSENVRGA